MIFRSQALGGGPVEASGDSVPVLVPGLSLGRREQPLPRERETGMAFYASSAQVASDGGAVPRLTGGPFGAFAYRFEIFVLMLVSTLRRVWPR